MGAKVKTIMTHAGTAVGAATATFAFLADNKADLYALWGQLNTIFAEITKFVAAATPIATAAYAVYRTSTKVRLAELVKDPKAAAAAESLPPSAGATAVANALTKGAVILIACMLFWPHAAYALDPITTSSCDPVTVFKGLTPSNFAARIKTCGDDDLKNAIDDANTAPVDFGALGCLVPVRTMRDAIVKGGFITSFQGFRRAKQNGLIAGCLNYVTSTVSLP